MKHITLAQAMERADLTQQQLEELSGVDRTRISRLTIDPDANPTIDTYDKLVTALHKKGALKRTEKLVFGRPESEAVA